MLEYCSVVVFSPVGMSHLSDRKASYSSHRKLDTCLFFCSSVFLCVLFNLSLSRITLCLILGALHTTYPSLSSSPLPDNPFSQNAVFIMSPSPPSAVCFGPIYYLFPNPHSPVYLLRPISTFFSPT